MRSFSSIGSASPGAAAAGGWSAARGGSRSAMRSQAHAPGSRAARRSSKPASAGSRAPGVDARPRAAFPARRQEQPDARRHRILDRGAATSTAASRTRTPHRGTGQGRDSREASTRRSGTGRSGSGHGVRRHGESRRSGHWPGVVPELRWCRTRVPTRRPCTRPGPHVPDRGVELAHELRARRRGRPKRRQRGTAPIRTL